MRFIREVSGRIPPRAIGVARSVLEVAAIAGLGELIVLSEQVNWGQMAPAAIFLSIVYGRVARAADKIDPVVSRSPYRR